MTIKNGVALVYENTLFEDADVTITCTKNALQLLIQANMDAFEQIAKIEGNTELLKLFVSNLNQFNIITFSGFNIIEP